MTDMNEALRDFLARREQEQRQWHEALFGQAPPEPPEPAAEAAVERFARAVGEARAAPPPIGFDGGARETPPGPAPSMDNLIRAGREQRTRERVERADQLDRAGPWR